jgi:hypothetical protein
LTKKDRQNRGRETSNVWAECVTMMCCEDSSADRRPDTIVKVLERMSMSCMK